MWFLLIPPVAVLLALLWVALRTRSVRTPEALITVEGYRRSMAALARPIEAAGGERRAGPDPSERTLSGPPGGST